MTNCNTVVDVSDFGVAIDAIRSLMLNKDQQTLTSMMAVYIWFGPQVFPLLHLRISVSNEY